MKSIIECIREYIMTFPELKDGCLLVDYLGSEPIEYTVEAVPCERIFKKYVDGGAIKQFLFIFASREFYNAEVTQCIENLEFYEHFEDWIEKQNLSDNLPDLDGRMPVSLEVLTGGYAFDEDAETARYQIQLRLLYED